VDTENDAASKTSFKRFKRSFKDSLPIIAIEDPNLTEVNRREMREYSCKLNKLSFLSECDILAIDVLKKKISSFDVEIQKKDHDIREQLMTLSLNEKKHLELQTEIDQYKKHKSMDTDNLKKHEEDLNKLQTIIKRAQNKIVDLKQEVNLSESNKIDTIKLQ